MARVLYISYTGLADPLGQSQVLQYLKALAPNHQITLLTFEKPAHLQDDQKIDNLAVQCRNAGIDWHRQTYHHRPGIPATMLDIMLGILVGRRLARRKDIRIVHTRSYVPGIIALGIRRALPDIRFIFDIRGFWPDERVDGGIWRRDSLVYRAVKRVERSLFLAADHVVSLTRAGGREIARFDYLTDRVPPVTVIPTCTNMDVFHHQPEQQAHKNIFTLGYVGSAGSWYLFDDVARAVALLFKQNEDARFLVINQGDHEAIRGRLKAQGVDMDRVEITAAPYDQVASYINRMTAGIFFIKPVFSKRASCPTKMGEFLACGIPCLANGGVGDVEEDLTETRTGIAIRDLDDKTLQQALADLVTLTAEPGIAERCRQAATDRFSLDRGVKRYDSIYNDLDGAT